MHLLQRYLFRSLVLPNLVGTFFFTLVFVLFRVGDLVSLCIEKGVSISTTLELFLYMLPFTAAITLPMGVLFSVLFVLGQMSENSEIIAMRANGFSMVFIYAPCILYGILMTLFVFWFMNGPMLEANRRYKIIYRNILYTNPSIILAEQVFSEFPGENAQHIDRKISVSKVGIENQDMKHVLVSEYDSRSRKLKLTQAQTGHWVSNTVNSPFVSLRLKEGSTLELDYERLREVQLVHFDQAQFNIRKQVREYTNKRKSPREISFLKVRKRVLKEREKDGKVRPRLLVEYHKKYAVPMMCLVFVLVGLPLGISFSRGRGTNFLFVIAIVFIYYIAVTWGEVFGRTGAIVPFVGMHLGNIVVLSLALGLFIFKMRR